jgi:hypothetical protein
MHALSARFGAQSKGCSRTRSCHSHSHTVTVTMATRRWCLWLPSQFLRNSKRGGENGARWPCLLQGGVRCERYKELQSSTNGNSFPFQVFPFTLFVFVTICAHYLPLRFH